MLFECTHEVNSDLSRVFECSLANSLRLKNEKKVLMINPSKSSAANIHVFKVRNLGVTFSYDLNLGDHVSTICRKVYGALARFRRLADVIPFAVHMRLFVALVIPLCPIVSFLHSILIC
jgi:hypothetical protein